ncbi:MAG TPA: hypothetical protein DD379_03110 [Cyanobacteria bacterium UBA11162]|nr:hypothetical protein [Cyanobacteria bacterium UBA11162]
MDFRFWILDFGFWLSITVLYDVQQITHNKKSPPLPLSASLFFRVIQPDMILSLLLMGKS